MMMAMIKTFCKAKEYKFNFSRKILLINLLEKHCMKGSDTGIKKS